MIRYAYACASASDQLVIGSAYDGAGVLMAKSETYRLDLADLVDGFEFRGKYTFTREEAQAKLQKTEVALRLSLNRLQRKGRIISPRRGFYVIVPAEYRLSGAPPPVWYIDKLMAYQKTDYYVALLSAAEVHGAAHQRPQEFQVMSARQLRPIQVESQRISFYRKWNLSETPVVQSKVPTGYINVSTPEATAYDLVRYFKEVGYLSNAATVISELSESMTAARLIAAGRKGVELAVLQRLGYLLEILGKDNLAAGIDRLLSEREPRITVLRPDLGAADAVLSRRWLLYVNDQVEPDL